MQAARAIFYIYQQAEHANQTERGLAIVNTSAGWQQRREDYRTGLCEMLGFEPCPEQTPRATAVTGKIDQEQYTVENVCTSSRSLDYL